MSATAPRVLMTADTVGGVFPYALSLARGLCSQGGELVLVTMGPAASVAQRLAAEAIAGVTLVETSYRLEWMEDPWADVQRAGRFLLELERELQPDVVHLNGYAHGALPFRAPTVVVAHSCVLSWWQAVHGEPAPARYQVYQQQVQRGLLQADRVIAPSHAMRCALLQHYGPLPSVQVLYNGGDVGPSAAHRKHAQIAAAGRVWDEAKNLAALARVAEELGCPVLIAGAGQQPESAQAAPLPGAARLLGALPHGQVQALFAESAIFASPARYEPFGLSILEAASASCALVLGDIPSLRELWSNVALFVPPDDEAALRRTLARLLEDPALCATLAGRARERAQRYSLARFLHGYLSLYASLMRAPARVAPFVPMSI